MISGQGDIAMAVSAIRAARWFIEKPFRGQEIVARLDEAIGAYAAGRRRIPRLECGTAFPGREPLTRREREVLEQFTSGASNKERDGISGSVAHESRIIAPTS